MKNGHKRRSDGEKIFCLLLIFYTDMSSRVVGPSSLPMSCTAQTHEHYSYFYLNMTLYLTMAAIIVNSIYSMMIYIEVRRLRRHVQEAEDNMIDAGRLLFNVTVNMRECLTKLLYMLYPQKMKTIVYGDM